MPCQGVSGANIGNWLNSNAKKKWIWPSLGFAALPRGGRESGEPDTRIRVNLAVFSHDWTLKDRCRCDQQLAGWIATERMCCGAFGPRRSRACTLVLSGCSVVVSSVIRQRRYRAGPVTCQASQNRTSRADRFWGAHIRGLRCLALALCNCPARGICERAWMSF